MKAPQEPGAMPEEEFRLLRRVLVTGITGCVDGGGEISRARDPGEAQLTAYA
jgi:hypothetical protein